MTLRTLCFGLLLWVLAIAPVAFGQDSVYAAAGLVKVEFENEQIRLLHARYPAHQKIAMHSHPSRVVVCVTDMHVLTTLAEPVKHSVENLEDTPFEVVEIELKKASLPAISLNPPSASTSALTEPVPVEREPHHHFVFQNQYIRVLDVFFPVGEVSLFHTHSNDNVGIPISGDKSQAQAQGGEWSEPQDVKPGAVGFRKARGQDYTHRVRSAGKLPFHVIDVEVFP
jgi:hypothetical protein